ncbi:MAG: dTMP kinase [Deltaproteobacteria bacterium]|nr:MAG: dTMP kinase [Deltaproteobacteria bacterium]
MGLLVTFEGIEGSGKSTQIGLVREFLEGDGYPCLVTKEPGGAPLGEGISGILLGRDDLRISPLAEVFLFGANRAQHVAEILRPALKEGKVVLCDRFTDATVAYQGYGRGVDVGLIEQVNRWATGDLMPDITILLDCPVELGMARAKGKDRFEREGYTFHQRVREGYLRIAHQEPQRVKVVSGEGEEGMIQEEIRKVLRPLLARR